MAMEKTIFYKSIEIFPGNINDGVHLVLNYYPDTCADVGGKNK